MNVRFEDVRLERLEVDPSYTMSLPPDAVKAFRKRIGFIRAAVDERDFYGMKSLHCEKLAGARSHQHSLRLNDQFRLIVELEGHSASKIVAIIKIEDYH